MGQVFKVPALSYILNFASTFYNVTVKILYLLLWFYSSS